MGDLLLVLPHCLKGVGGAPIGETEWSRSGQHTSRTDLPLTRRGEEQAKSLAPLLAGRSFALVLTWPCLPDLRGRTTPGTAPRRTAASPKYVQYEGDAAARRCSPTA